MKQISTTVNIRQIFIAVVFVAIAGLLVSPFTVFANKYQDQINDLDRQIEAAEGQISRLQGQANTLKNKLNILAAEKAVLQQKINRNESKRKKIVDDIRQTEKKIAEQQEFLGNTLGDLYVDSSITPIEMLASSKTIGDFIDQQSYRTTISDGLQASIKKIKELRKKLAAQKKEVEGVLAQQKGQRDELAAKQAEQNELLAVTRGQESRYRGLVSDLAKKREAAEAALIDSLRSGAYKNVAPVGNVGAGDRVGSVGTTGLSTGYHLHLEVRDGNGNTTNPMSHVKAQPVPMPPGSIGQPYGATDCQYYRPPACMHPGQDYPAPEGTPIYAIQSGVLRRGWSSSLIPGSGDAYGCVAIVSHSSGYVSIYGHMTPSSCN